MPYVENIAGREWVSQDGMASEYELGDFMYGLIRELKPRVVLETGCYLGHTTIPMADALRGNKMGLLHTCDTDSKVLAEVEEKIRAKLLPCFCYHMTGEELARTVQGVGLAFLDSSGDRVAEAKALRMHPDGIVVLHDAHRPTYMQIAQAFPKWLHIKLPTPRGLAIFQVAE